MRILVFVLLWRFALGSVLTYRPMIIDEYETEQNIEDMRNPYFNATPTPAHLLYQAEVEQPIPIYNLELKKVNEISEISVECYDFNRCDQSVSELERKYLTVYASMIEACGRDNVAESYSIGLIRNRYNENLMGRFTKSWNPDTMEVVHMAFWIRLSRGYGTARKYIYDDLEGYALTVALLEMSVHERAHYDVTTYDPSAGHCDGFQAWYNTLIHSSIYELDKFNDLTNHILGDRKDSNGDYTWIIVSVSVGVVVIVGVVVFMNARKSKRKDLGKPLLT